MGIWEINETENELRSKLKLDDATIALYNSMQFEQRRLQWLSSRVLLKELSGKEDLIICYDDRNKPFAANYDFKLSLTHSGKYAAAIIDEKKETGIDLELMRDKIQGIAKKFMQEEELSSITENYRTEQLFVYWCAKESLYKLYGKKELIFKENILIEAFKYEEKGRIFGSIKTENSIEKHLLEYEKFNEYMLSYVVA